MSRLHVCAQLVRLPALPTALADICLGALAVGALPARWLPFLLVALASACLYCGGMVWNDFFDVEQDRRERPFRPIPSGKVSRRAAGLFGAGLLAGGVLAALLAGRVLAAQVEGAHPFAPAALAVGLVAAILLYDARLKRTWAGPPGMGTCRFLNVLLGTALSGTAPGGQGVYLALIVGVYVVGVTWLARTEARASSAAALAGAAAVMAMALVLALPLPLSVQQHPGQTASPLFPYLLVALGFVVGLPVARAIGKPVPSQVQAAVKRSLIGLILLDAVLATALVGWPGLSILVLLAPALYLARRRWLYAT
jgi:4-hydroxybenzoate polyprenyltransferase